MVEYSQKLIEHFQNPRNVGVVENADGVGKVGSPICGDVIHVYVKIEKDRIVDIKYKTFGCAAAIASGSVMTEIVRGKTISELLAGGKTIEDAVEILKADIIEALDGMPEQKVHCSLLAADGFYNAIRDYISIRSR